MSTDEDIKAGSNTANTTVEQSRIKVKKEKIKHGVTEYIHKPVVERVRKKRGRKQKYNPESKALDTVNPNDASYKLNQFFKGLIKNKYQIPTFEECMGDEHNSFTIKCIFNDIDFTDALARKTFASRYAKVKSDFFKDAEKKLKATLRNKYSNLKDCLTNENIIEHFKQIMSENSHMFDVTEGGKYIFDLSKMSGKLEGVYATLSTDNILKDKNKIEELRNELNRKQLELDYHTMELNYGEVYLRKSEIITEIDGNNLNRMLINKTKKVIKSTDEELKHIQEIPTAEQILITSKKQKILDVYKTAKDIVKKV